MRETVDCGEFYSNEEIRAAENPRWGVWVPHPLLCQSRSLSSLISAIYGVELQYYYLLTAVLISIGCEECGILVGYTVHYTIHRIKVFLASQFPCTMFGLRRTSRPLDLVFLGPSAGIWSGCIIS